MESMSQALRRVTQSRAHPAPRFRYTPAIQVGAFAFVSGLVGLDPATGNLAQPSAAAETKQVLENLRSLCEEQGWSINRLVFARVYCAGTDVAAKVNAAWDEFFHHDEPPARSFVTVKALPLGAAVEIEFQLLV